jgi:hypothetical protein
VNYDYELSRLGFCGDFWRFNLKQLNLWNELFCAYNFVRFPATSTTISSRLGIVESFW